MPAEAMMLSPMPCKALESACSVPTSPYAPSEIDVQELGSARPFWYDVDEATNELRDMMSCKMDSKTPLPVWIPAFGSRSLSAASTCATSPPPRCPTSPPLRSSISESSSPDYALVAPSDLDDRTASPTLEQQPPQPPGALDKSSWLQARKVFVGGIPQTIDQNGLYQMFSKVGKVKKAWLQLFHNDRATSQTAAVKKHRGFGFVIFYEKQAIDQLLGNDSSRFVCLGNDLKLEVKRAFGKTGVKDEPPSTGKSKTPGPQPSVTSPVPLCHSHESGPCATPLASPAPQTLQSGASVQNNSGSFTTPLASPAPQAFQSGAWITPQTWRPGFAGQTAVIVGFPIVPPFPFAESQPVCNTQTLTAVPAPCEAPVAQATIHHQAPCQFLPGVIFQQFVGQKPMNSEALTQALLQAMPDHYED